MNIGIISDTHGLLRPQALTALAGSDHILHAGDVGDIAILDGLKRIAPVTAIRGNIDRFGPCAELPETQALELAGSLFYLVHSLEDLAINPAAAGIACLVTGHSHRPIILEANGVLSLNPGSAGPRRFKLPITVARVQLSGGKLTAEIIHLIPAT